VLKDFLGRLWSDLQERKNLELYLVLTIAAVILGADILGISSISIFFEIVLAVLALLVYNAIDQRHTQEELEKQLNSIEQQLQENQSIIMQNMSDINSMLKKNATFNMVRDRSQLVDIEEMAAGATEIAAAGITLVSIVTPRYDFFTQKAREGCKLRFLLLDPDSLAAQVWNSGQRIITTSEDNATTLKTLQRLMQNKGLKGKCEVRLTQFQLPFSIVITDPDKDQGRMNVEFLAYKTSLPRRPHIHLSRRESEKWFKFFSNQFEQLWSDATRLEL
jgi:hypothetical protein